MRRRQQGVLQPDDEAAAEAEVGSASADLSSIRIDFTGAYHKAIIVAGIPTHNGDEETAIRIQQHPRRMCGLPKPNTDAPGGIEDRLKINGVRGDGDRKGLLVNKT